MDGKKLKELLTQKGIKQAEVAKVLGITKQSMFHMFDNQDIKSGVLETICKSFNLELNYFYPEICISDEQYKSRLEYYNQLMKLKDERIAQLEAELAMAKSKIG